MIFIFIHEILTFISTWIIHESRLLQMRDTRHEGVVLHCECLVAK